MAIFIILFSSFYFAEGNISFKMLISMFEWATLFILPWVFLYWIVRFIKGYESKETEKEQNKVE